jgi:hypothetical protein
MLQVDSPHQGQLGLLLILLVRVADPHYLNADPDPTFFLNADPDPAFQSNADPILLLIKVMAGS